MNCISLNAEDVYEVERIIKKKRHPTKGDLYLTKWKNFPNSENTWEPAENFPRKLIESFESVQMNKRIKTNHSSTSANISATSNQTTTSNNNKMLESSSSSTLDKSYSSGKFVVINPVGKHSLPIVREVFYEPELPKEPVIITDVSTDDSTVTICECSKREGFFRQFD